MKLRSNICAASLEGELPRPVRAPGRAWLPAWVLRTLSCRKPVAQASKPAVSPTSSRQVSLVPRRQGNHSGLCWRVPAPHCRGTPAGWKPAIQQVGNLRYGAGIAPGGDLLDPVRARSRSSGFTLMEMALALAVSAIALAGIGGVFFSAMRLRERTTAMLDAEGPVQNALSYLRRDLQGALPPYLMAGDFKLGALTLGAGASAGSMGGGFGLQFSTTTGSLKEDSPWGDVQEVIYELRDPAQRTSGRGKDLIRSVNRNLLSTGVWETDDQFLMANVERFEVSCFDGTQWREDWDTSLTDTNLPVAVRVRLMPAMDDSVDRRSVQPIDLVVPIVSQSRTNTVQQTQTTGGGA